MKRQDRSLLPALAGSALVHAALIAAFGWAPRPEPHRPQRIVMEIVTLPSVTESAGVGEGPETAAPGAGADASDPSGSGEARGPVAGKPAPRQPPRLTRRSEAREAKQDAGAIRTAADEAIPPKEAEATLLATAPDADAPPTASDDGVAHDGSTDTDALPRDDRTSAATADTNGSGSFAGSGSGAGAGPLLAANGGPFGGGGGGRGFGRRNVEGDEAAVLLAHLRAHTARCYPRAAQRRRTQGTVEIAFCLDGAGSPEQVEVRRSSGSPLLDDAAVDCVLRGSAPLPAPNRCASVPIDFRLR